MQKIFIFDKYFFIFYEIFNNFHKNRCIYLQCINYNNFKGIHKIKDNIETIKNYDNFLIFSIIKNYNTLIIKKEIDENKILKITILDNIIEIDCNNLDNSLNELFVIIIIQYLLYNMNNDIINKLNILEHIDSNKLKILFTKIYNKFDLYFKNIIGNIDTIISENLNIINPLPILSFKDYNQHFNKQISLLNKYLKYKYKYIKLANK